MRRDGLRGPGQLAGAFFRSPVILAILAGLAGNVLGVRDFLYTGPVTGALMETLGFLSALTVPLILIIVGYGIQLDRAGIRAALPVIGVRLAVLIPVGAVLILGVVRGLLGLGRPFEAALFTLLILPPPFIIPLYMPDGGEDERRYVNNVLTLYTVVSVALFSAYLISNQGCRGRFLPAGGLGLLGNSRQQRQKPPRGREPRFSSPLSAFFPWRFGGSFRFLMIASLPAQAIASKTK
jgi:hypothetical protein